MGNTPVPVVSWVSIAMACLFAAPFAAADPPEARTQAKVKPIFLEDPIQKEWRKNAWLVAFSPDDKTLLSYSSYPRIYYWDLSSNKLAKAIELERLVPINDPVISSDSKVFACTGFRKLIVRQCFPDQEIKTFDWDIGIVRAISTDTNLIAISRSSGSISCLNRISAEKSDLFKAKVPDWALLAFSIDQRFLFAAIENHIQCFDLKRKEIVREITLGANRSVQSLSPSPDGKSLIVGCQCYGGDGGEELGIPAGAGQLREVVGGELQVWDMSMSKVVVRKDGSKWGSSRIVWSPTKQFFATASGIEGTIELWSANDYEQLGSFDFGIKGLTHMAISHDGKKMAACFLNDKVIVWDIQLGAPEKDDRTSPK